MDVDAALLWLWPRPAATAPIGPLAWEPPCGAGAALKSQKKKKERKKEKKKKTVWKYLRKLYVDPAIPLLHIYLDKTFLEKDT